MYGVGPFSSSAWSALPDAITFPAPTDPPFPDHGDLPQEAAPDQDHDLSFEAWPIPGDVFADQPASPADDDTSGTDSPDLDYSYVAWCPLPNNDPVAANALFEDTDDTVDVDALSYTAGPALADNDPVMAQPAIDEAAGDSGDEDQDYAAWQQAAFIFDNGIVVDDEPQEDADDYDFTTGPALDDLDTDQFYAFDDDVLPDDGADDWIWGVIPDDVIPVIPPYPPGSITAPNSLGRLITTANASNASITASQSLGSLITTANTPQTTITAPNTTPTRIT